MTTTADGNASGRGNEQTRQGGTRRPLYVAIGFGLIALALGLFWLCGEGTLTVHSTPSGAAVVLDGRSVGTTPYTFSTRLAALTGSLELRLDGYETQSLTYAVQPRASGEMSASLVAVAKPAHLEVRSTPDGADVYLDGTHVGKSPLTLDNVAVQAHSLRITHADYLDWSESVNVAAGTVTQVDTKLTVAAASVAISSTPGQARVLVDGADRGLTPVQIEDLPPGEHVVKVSRAGYEDAVKTLRLAPNSNEDVKITLIQSLAPVASPERPVAAMIDNHPDARPQSGLSAADVVYEALAEGGITRFMTIFSSLPAEVVGPIRSSRHYFVWWADEYNALYAHCGGYSEAYAAIDASGIADFDDLQGSPGFWRSAAREAPHNLYTSTDNLRSEAERRGLKPDNGTYGGLLFKNDAAGMLGDEAGRVDLYYPSGYSVAWEYNKETNDYGRYTSGVAHTDANTGQQVRASNLIVMWAKNWFIGRDDQQDFEQVGSGHAQFFIDGHFAEGTWTREALTEPTYFWNAAGERVPLNAGGTNLDSGCTHRRQGNPRIETRQRLAHIRGGAEWPRPS